MEEDITEQPQVSWNLSQALIAEIANLLQRASGYYVEGKFWQSFDCLKATKFRFIQSLNKEEREKFEKQEAKVSGYLRFHIPALGYDNPNLWAKIRGVIRQEVDIYNVMVMDSLNKYGYLIKPKETAKEMF